MGYYAEFDFDIAIPAGKVEAAEQALDSCAAIIGEIDVDDDRDIVSIMESFWDVDCDARIIEPDALTQLAIASSSSSSARRFEMTGRSYCKWGDWDESIFTELAPFVTPESYVLIRGEEHELVRYSFCDSKLMIETALEVFERDDLYKKVVDSIVTQLQAGSTHIECAPIIKKYMPGWDLHKGV